MVIYYIIKFINCIYVPILYIFTDNFILKPYHANVVRNGTVGRPAKDISDEQLLYLRQLGFTWSSMCNLLGVSRSTLYRRKLLLNDETITYNEHEVIIREILQATPDAGEVYVLAALKARNIRVQRWKVREKLQIIDPIGRALRRKNGIQRRVYKVKGANYLWCVNH